MSTVTESAHKISICPSALREISVLAELILGHLCYRLTDVPPQPNSQPDKVFGQRQPKPCVMQTQSNTTSTCQVIVIYRVSETASEVVVFHGRQRLPLILHPPSCRTLSD